MTTDNRADNNSATTGGNLVLTANMIRSSNEYVLLVFTQSIQRCVGPGKLSDFQINFGLVGGVLWGQLMQLH